MTLAIGSARNAVIPAIIDKILDGSTLRDALKAADMTPQQFAGLLAKDKEAATAYARAAELRADLLADEVISIADGDADPAKARNQITARQWLASKLNAKRYGDRIDLNVTQTLDVSATLLEARSRVLQPVRDQLTHEEPETLDVPARIVSRVGNGGLSVRDQEPPEDAAPLVPDIFS